MTAKGWLALAALMVLISIQPLLYLLLGVQLDDLVIMISGGVGALVGVLLGHLMVMSHWDYKDRARS